MVARCFPKTLNFSSLSTIQTTLSEVKRLKLFVDSLFTRNDSSRRCLLSFKFTDQSVLRSQYRDFYRKTRNWRPGGREKVGEINSIRGTNGPEGTAEKRHEASGSRRPRLKGGRRNSGGAQLPYTVADNREAVNSGWMRLLDVCHPPFASGVVPLTVKRLREG